MDAKIFGTQTAEVKEIENTSAKLKIVEPLDKLYELFKGRSWNVLHPFFDLNYASKKSDMKVGG